MNWHDIFKDVKLPWVGALGGVTLSQINEVLSAISLTVAIVYTLIRILKETRKDKGERK